MRKILQKIAWKTHRWTTKVSLLNIYLGANHGKFGIQVLNIDKGVFWEGSLFEVTWVFPTVTHRGELIIDLFFMYDKWNDWCIDMIDRKLWGSELTRWERVNLWLNTQLKKIS